MFTKDDIQIFVATHNRAGLLKTTLENLLSQTVGISQITVLDNESTDNTREVALSLADKGVQYVATTGFLGNFKKARTLVNKPYCMIFHDDDLLHPQYLAAALKALNTYSNVSLVTCAYTPFTHGTQPQIPDTLSTQHICFHTARDWACYMYFFEGVSYAPAIYRTEDFLKTELEFEKFNKFNDWPFLVKFGKWGNVVFLQDGACVFARQHPGQDSNNAANFPDLQQIVYWDKCFFSHMGAPAWYDPLYWVYGAHNTHFLLGKFNAAPDSFKEKYTKKDLQTCVRQMGLPAWGFYNIRPLKDLFINSLTRKLRRKLLAHVKKDF